MPSINRAMMDNVLESSFAMKIAEKLLEFVSKVPESQYSKTENSAESSSKLKQRSCVKAAATSAALAFPVGPIGWLTIVPELLAVWRIQGHMVADIAAMHGHSDKLTKEVMLYCLFNHSASQAIKDVTARVGERAFLRSTSTSMARQITARVGTRFTQKAVQRMVTRWVPVIGALGMAAYVYYDTNKVAKTAMTYFANPFPITDENLSEVMEKAHQSDEDSTNKVDQLAETVKQKAEDLAGKAKDQWQHYRDKAQSHAGSDSADDKTSASSGKDQQRSAFVDTERSKSAGKMDMKEKTDHLETSAMPHKQEAAADTETVNDSPIVTGGNKSDTFQPSSSATSSTSQATSSDSNKSPSSNDKLSSAKIQAGGKGDTNSKMADDKSVNKTSSNHLHNQTNGSNKPQSGLYQ